MLSSETFKALTAMYQQQCAADILGTKPEDAAGRERTYAAFSGFNDFIALAQKFAEAHEKLTTTPTVSDTTDDDIDDPRVHNIYSMDELN